MGDERPPLATTVPGKHMAGWAGGQDRPRSNGAWRICCHSALTPCTLPACLAEDGAQDALANLHPHVQAWAGDVRPHDGQHAVDHGHLRRRTRGACFWVGSKGSRLLLKSLAVVQSRHTQRPPTLSWSGQCVQLSVYSSSLRNSGAVGVPCSGATTLGSSSALTSSSFLYLWCMHARGCTGVCVGCCACVLNAMRACMLARTNARMPVLPHSLPTRQGSHPLLGLERQREHVVPNLQWSGRCTRGCRTHACACACTRIAAAGHHHRASCPLTTSPASEPSARPSAMVSSIAMRLPPLVLEALAD